MSTPTANLALGKAVDADNAETYLATTLASALDTLDSKFSGGSGTIPYSVLAANAATNVAYASSATQLSTTSASFVLMSGASVTLTTEGGVVVVTWSGSIVNASSANVSLGWQVDGGGFASYGYETLQPGLAKQVSFTFVIPAASLTAGVAHTIDIGWNTSAGTVQTQSNVNYTTVAREFRR